MALLKINTMNKKIKLLFLTDELEGNGNNRVMVNILNNISRDKFSFSLVLSERRGIFLNDLREDVKITGLIKTEYLKDERFFPRVFRYVQRFYKVCKIINSEKPDIVLCPSYTLGLIAVFAKLFVRKTNIILLTQNHMSIVLEEECHNVNDNFVGRIIVPKLLYRKVDEIICVSEGICDDLNKSFGIPKTKITVIYNGCDRTEINKLKNEEIHDGWFKKTNLKIISVGRLHHQKGYEYLLKAFKLVTENEINASLIILGEGIEKTNLEKLVRVLGIENYVIFAGFKENPYKYMKNSDVFVLSSIYEGFGYVIVEAMACGVPVIATRCPSGPDEIITDNVNGILVPMKDENALANAIIDLLIDKDKAERLMKEGIKRSNDFRVKKMVEEYERVFINLYKHKV